MHEKNRPIKMRREKAYLFGIFKEINRSKQRQEYTDEF